MDSITKFEYRKYIEYFINIVGKENIFIDEPMKNHTSFKVGGNVDIMIMPSTIEELKKLIVYINSNNLKYYIIGNGSNILVGDKGFRGIILKICDNMCNILIENNYMIIDSGAKLSSISSKALENKLSGFEFASGIPGTFGGAVCMNAGAYGGEIKDILVSINVITKEGILKTIKANELKLSYRSSIIPENNYIIVSGIIKLQYGNYGEIKNNIMELAKRRREKQPLNFASAGSTFKRPEGYFTGQLITDSGLKGYNCNDAEVSEKHAGFIINKGNAKARDIINVIKHCQNTVYDKFGVKLETEVKIIGEF